MFARLSADTELIRAYASAASRHAADLTEVAARLTTVGAAPSSMFGPVGTSFQAALSRAAAREARAVADLGAALAAAHPAARSTAQTYESVDAEAGTRLTGSW